jgi:hypothetical protein
MERKMSEPAATTKLRNTGIILSVIILLVAVSFITQLARAETLEIELRIRDHLFFPDTLVIPANQKVRIRIFNEDPTPEEFESFELNREKVIAGNSQTVIFIGPLKEGEYFFFGEFFPKTAQGVVIVE